MNDSEKRSLSSSPALFTTRISHSAKQLAPAAFFLEEKEK